MPSKAANMKRIAELAGVSIATVSLGLRNHPRISAETSERIQKIAAEIGYKPNPMVSTLMAQLRASHPPEYAATLALINSFPQRDFRLLSPTASRFFDGCRVRAEKLGYRLEEFWMHEPGMTPKRLSSVLLARGIAGVLIGPLPKGRGQLRLDWPNFASAALGYSVVRPNLHRAVHDQFSGMKSMMSHICRLRYRRIGLAMPEEFDERTNHNYLAGLLVGNHYNAGKLTVGSYIQPNWNKRSFAEWFHAFHPDILVCSNEHPFKWLQELGVRVPDDVGFALLDWSPRHAFFAGIDQNTESIGEAAVDLVVGQLHRNERGIPAEAKLVLTAGHWVNGSSVKQQKR